MGRIARNRRKTGIIAEGEQDNVDLWRKIKHIDESLAHLVSTRIVQFAHHHGASILVFEHLGNLKPERGKYSRWGNSKRAFWMKGRIFNDAKYKAWDQRIISSRVNPRNTSRECARCHSLVARYQEGQPAEGYTEGAPLVLCLKSGMQGHADRNASLVIGQRLVARFQKPLQEKPSTPLLRVERVEKSTGVLLSRGASNAKKSHLLFEQGMEGGTSMAPLKGEGVGWERLPHLFLANYGCRLSRGCAPCLRQPTTQEWKKLPGFNPAECHLDHLYRELSKRRRELYREALQRGGLHEKIALFCNLKRPRP